MPRFNIRSIGGFIWIDDGLVKIEVDAGLHFINDLTLGPQPIPFTSV